MAHPIILKAMPAGGAGALPTGWHAARTRLEGLPGGGLNIAHEAVDRHVAAGHGAQAALIWLGREEQRQVLTYADLAGQAARFAHVLRAHGIAPGERMFLLSGRVPAFYAATLGALKAGVVVSPLFAAFGPEPVRARMEIGGASVLVTTAQHYARKVAPWRAEMPGLRLVLIMGDDAPEGCAALGPAMAAAPATFDTHPTKPEDMALLHFTSGTTGLPKGVVHVHQAVVAHAETGRLALDLRPGDIYWCTADPGWVTGMSYGIISPLCNRVTMVVDEAEFDLDRWYTILEREGVQVWYTAPTAIRMLMRAGNAAAKGHDFSALRFLASVGEPLNAECVIWGNQTFGLPFHDNWWQSETGGIMIGNTAEMDIKPGAMGKPLPGIVAGIVARDGDSVTEQPDGSIGELALRPGWPSMMRAYLGQPERYAKCFAGGWYLTGDLALRDSDGYYWFVGRADDLIKSAGHLIGPFEVESALIEHPAVAEAAVIGIPDETAGEVVKAFVTLKAGFMASDALERELRGHARKRLGPAVAPREIVFRDSLPRTRSGKIMRRLLRARELGLPEGDLSTLEGDAEMTKVKLDHAHASNLLRGMIRIRRFEEKCYELYTQEKIRGFLHLYDGEEAVAVGVSAALEPRDRVVSTYREHGHALARGMSMESALAEMYGKATGCAGGRGGSMHLFDAETNLYGGNAIVGGGLPLAVGLGLGDMMQGQDRVSVCFFGDGALAEGEFHESMNLAALWKLPVLFVLENNLYAMGSAVARVQANTDFTPRAVSYGMPAESVDGNDVVAVEAAARRLVEAMRAGSGPQFLECQTYRTRPHSMFDAEKYRDKAEVAEWRKRAPITRFQSWLLDNNLLHQAEVDAIEAEVEAQLRNAVAACEQAPLEPVEDLLRHVVAETRPAPPDPVAPTPPVDSTYRECCRQAITEALLRDDRVFMMGEDIGAYGGCYAVSLGLLKEFGPERIRDTPLSESGFTGAGIGAALVGMRPIVEIMTVNFSLLALDQILNTAATIRHMSAGQFGVPLVIRMATGAGRQLAAQHSHSLETFFAHIPGLRVVAPATLEDARGMLATALEDPDPVIILEHVMLYNMAGKIAANAGAVDIDRAVIRRSGRDVTLIAWSYSLWKVLEAAEALAKDGIEAEVVDLRTLRPLDDATIMASVARTRRAVIVDEGWRTGSLSAEIAARVQENCFFQLDAPVARVCSAEVPVPYPKHLETAALPQVADIIAVVKALPGVAP